MHDDVRGAKAPPTHMLTVMGNRKQPQADIKL